VPDAAKPSTRQLDEAELDALVELDAVAHLATIAPSGFPRVTPIWFLWTDGAFYMTSVDAAAHVADLRRDTRSAICIDIEDTDPTDFGIRPNASVRACGTALLSRDVDGYWTRRITRKYIPGESGLRRADYRAQMERTVIQLRPTQLIARGTAERCALYQPTSRR
jgi:hypothetical protein